MVTEEKEIDWERWIKREDRGKRKAHKKDPPNVGRKKAKNLIVEDDDDEDDEAYAACLEESRSDLFWRKEDKEDPLADIWRDWDVEIEKERRRVPELIKYKDIEVLIDSCDHEFVFREDCGKVCEICGRVVQLVSDIFDLPIPVKKQTSKPKEKLKLHEDYALRLEDPIVDMDIDLLPHPSHREWMYQHQREAFNFMIYNLLAKKPGGVILHHAPGTGKTFLVISFLTSFFAKFPTSRAMILAPKSMLKRWKEEFRKWEVTSIPVHIYEGGESTVLYQWASENRGSSVLVMTPQLLASKLANNIRADVGDESWLLSNLADVLVFDEAHYARNDNTRIAEALMTVTTTRRIFLSGTVFQNNLDELYNLFMLCRRDFLTRVMEQFELDAGDSALKDDPERYFFRRMVDNRLESNLGSAIRFFRKVTASFLHWHDGKVLRKLPGLEEVLVVLNLTDTHKALLLDPGSNSSKKGFLAEDSKFARACIHPCLAEDVDNPQLELQDPKAGAKTAFVMDLLHFLRRTRSKEKVIIFGQYNQPLNLLKQMIRERLGWEDGSELLHMTGQTPLKERARICDAFNKRNSVARVILVSIKACGEGISLVGGSRVVMLDTAWNPSTVRQAVSRAFRIGQTDKVYVYRLLVGNVPEVEEDKLKRSLRKDFLAMALFNTDLSPELLVKQAGMDKALVPVPVEETEDEFLEPFLYEGSEITYNCKGLYHLPSGWDKVAR